MVRVDFSLSQIAWLVTGACLVGIGKGGLPGVGNLAIVIFASQMPVKVSTGALLPVLIAADVMAVLLHRSHTQWESIRKLMPWAVLGVIGGWLVMGRITDVGMKNFIGITLVLLTLFQLWRTRLSRHNSSETALPASPPESPGLGCGVPHVISPASAASPASPLLAPGLGLLAGFATMLANAAGPVAAVFFLMSRLPKFAFLGTSAMFFFLLNVFKLPFQATLGQLGGPVWELLLWTGPAAALGVLAGPHLARRISQAWFERLVWSFILLAGVLFLF